MKKAKNKKQRKRGNDKSFIKMYNQINDLMSKDVKVKFDSIVKDISRIFLQYSPSDIAISLFVSSMWLPNIASPIKHQLLVSIFASLKPEEFSNSNTINSYSDFRNLIQEVYSLVPSFEMLEDYIPETDWGDVKFHHEGRNFKIFYGNELSNVYDYLTLFQMIYLPFENEYYDLTGRSASQELKNCLQLQDDIISGITTQPTTGSAKELSLGHLEIPPKRIWEDAARFYKSYKPEQYFNKSFLNNYSLLLGDWPSEFLKWEIFQDMVFHGMVVPVFFVSCTDQYFPILPRRYSSILFNSWSQMYEDNHNKVVRDDMPYSFYIGGELHQHIKQRVSSSFLFPIVSAVTKEGLPHEILFSTVFISKNRLILIYVTNPAYSGKQIQDEIERAIPKLEEAVNQISRPPLTLALHLEQKNAVFPYEPGKESLRPTLFVVIPQASTVIPPISIPKTCPGKIVFLDQFLGIVDELENAEMLASFMEYVEEYGESIPSPLISPLDIFGSFKITYGVLVEGARKVDFIGLYPHLGSNMRYETLLKFWKLYPEVDFFDHPRSWKVTKETESRVRLEARGYFGCALYCQVGKTHVYLNSPFDKMSYEQGMIANLLMECLEDAISRHKDVIEKHNWFQSYGQLQVLFFPLSLISNNDAFNHLKHLNPIGKYWCSDYGLMKPGLYGIRLVFDDKTLAGALISVKDRSLEIDLLLEVLMQLDEIEPDTKILLIKNALDKQKAGKPRFKLFEARKDASFPEFINPHEPELTHFKKAKKRISELARECNLMEGDYDLDDAKTKLNGLREAVVKEVNSEVEKYDFKSSLLYLLSRIDSLTDRYKRNTVTIKYSLEHETDYSREESYATEHSNYINLYKNYRYLIEKFVQLQPRGQIILDKEQFQYLIALIDWLLVFYSASDSLHYGIHPVGMRVNEDFLVEVKYEGNIKAQEEEFIREEAKMRLGLIGNPDDRVSSPRQLEDFLDALDESFKKDLGFSFRSMINVLQVMAHWGELNPTTDINPYYSATAKEIEEICLNNVNGINKEEINPILNFLTLRSDDVIRLTGQEETCHDLPVWEHRKRYARYGLRPLILIDDKYYWGPYSTMSSGIIWSGNLSNGTLPIDLQTTTIQSELNLEKKLIEDALVVKAFEIVKKFTEFVEKNCELHKLDVLEDAPLDLGDYDVPAFYPEKNVVLNIECKDILPVFCLKDLKRLREKIFGREGKDEGHFSQINKREAYLSKDFIKIAKALKWPIDVNNLPKIISIYLTSKIYWWTKFPPKEVKAVFLQIDMLSNFIKDLEES